MNTFKKKYFRKKLGQNFLINKKIIKDIISIINPKNNQLLLEIGPGWGALTNPICKLIEKLIVIEIDSKLLHSLKNCTFTSKLKIFHNNALHFDYLKLAHKKKN